MSKKNVDTKKVATFRCRPQKDRKRSFLDIILNLIFNTKMIKIKYILFNKSNIIKLLMHIIFTKLVKLIFKIIRFLVKVNQNQMIFLLLYMED